MQQKERAPLFEVISDKPGPGQVEFTERKGRGHPDSLADALAELISYEYSRYCMAEFGVILHHYFDKLVILGGQARVAHGRYQQDRPLQVVINGRVSHRLGRAKIPVTAIAQATIAAYLPTVLPLIKDSHWEVTDNTSLVTGSSAKGWHWWEPRGSADIPELRLRRANDTSVSVATSPYTPLEAAVIDAEQALFDAFAATGQCGSDVKILAARIGTALSVTACVPVLAGGAVSQDDYETVKDQATSLIERVFTGTSGVGTVSVAVNTRDDPAIGDLYLLGLGTAAEHGDIGAVGRGNRASGLITTETPMSIETPQGKNPVYFTGVVYDACARAVSRVVYDRLALPNTIYLASQNGRPIASPWQAVVRIPATAAASPAHVSEVAWNAFQQARKISALFDGIRRRYPHLAPIPGL